MIVLPEPPLRHPREGGDPGDKHTGPSARPWVPAYAGMTVWVNYSDAACATGPSRSSSLAISGSAALVAQTSQDDPLVYISSAWNIVHIMIALLLLLIFIGWRIATINMIAIQITPHKSVTKAVKSSLLAPLLVTFWFTSGLVAVGSMIGIWLNAVRFMMDIGAALAILLSLLCLPIIFLRYGGFTLIQHLSMRMILSLCGYLPMRLSSLLNYCVQMGLFYCIGGGYRFIHSVLQDRYARINK